jgi:hypothetical protein
MSRVLSRRWKPSRIRSRAGVTFLAATIVASAAGMSGSVSLAAGAPSAVLVLANRTIPSGAVWLDGALGGHWWFTDTGGTSRIDRLNGATPPWQATNTSGAAKSGGQMLVGPAPATLNGAALPAGAKLVYVADNSSKSVSVVRFVYNPANETLNSPLAMKVTNPTFVGGGSGGGRPSAVALAPNGADLYVGYLKSGDIMRVTGAKTTTSTTPPQAKVGTTSDGRGVNAFVTFGNDLYISELGGFGLSKIADPSGVARPACSAASVCTASSITPQIESFPGGLATDGTYIYIGHAPFTSSGSVLRWDPTAATGATNPTIVAQNVPTYTEQSGTFSQLFGPLAIGLATNGDMLVGDDPQFAAAAPLLLQGHIWLVPAIPAAPTVTAIAPGTGLTTGGDVLTVTGTGFAPAAGATSINFGAAAGTNVTCASVTSCTVTSPAAAGAGTVDVIVTVAGQQSAAVAADQFIYTTPAPPATGPSITGIAPARGVPDGGTVVTITGTNLATVDGNGAVTGQPSITFGVNPATGVSCASATSCTATSPAGTGTVDVQVTLAAASSAAVAADRFAYTTPSTSLYAWGITAPKGGAVWVPGALGGHWWSSDHAQGFCRQDAVPGTTLHAINYNTCGPDAIGSAGQAVYEPRVNADGSHYIYVPDNAVKSTAVWRLTFNPATETVGTVAEAMIPLADVRTLKPNGMALGPDGNLYVSDLTEKYIRQITNPAGDPRTQTVGIVAQTGDGRGANGTIGFLGNNLYVSENRAAASFDVTTCPVVDPATGGVPCNTNPIPLPAGVFVAGVATDPVNNLVYASNSPGGAGAEIWRYNATTGAPATLYVTGGQLPAAGSPDATVYCSLTCTRPWDPAFTPGGTAGFSFAFGLAVGPTGALIVTEDSTAGARSARGTMWSTPFVP